MNMIGRRKIYWLNFSSFYKLINPLKMRIFLVTLVLSLSSVLSAQSQAVDTQIVYVTETGQRYHKGHCQYLKTSKIETTEKQAKADGYTPCKVCFRSAASSSTQSKTKTNNYTSSRCQATTQKGTQCKLTAASGSRYC